MKLFEQSDEHLASQYRQMHAKGAFPGQTWRKPYEILQGLLPDLGQLRIVDFGCGPHGGVAQSLPENVSPYDPYVEKYSTPPWDQSFDLLFSSDVFEHMRINDIKSFLKVIQECKPTHVFLNISTRKAHKTLPDGSNAHLTVKPGRWWMKMVSNSLGSEYSSAYASEDLLGGAVSLLFSVIEQNQ